MRRKPWSHVDDPHAAGRRLRAARESAGLSQRQLAFPGCTAAYISRLESGDRTPSLQLLREIGKRLGVSADWLATGSEAEPADPLLDAELSLRLGDLEEAEREFADARERGDPREQALALAGLGRVALARGDVAGAERRLEEARAALGDAVMATPAVLEALGEAYAMRGDPGAAAALFEDALQRAGDDRAAATRWSLRLATALLDSGDADRAAALAAEAAPTAKELADPARLARLYRGQAKAYSARGEPVVGARCARRALNALEFADERRDAARASHLLASVELERGDPARALEIAESALVDVRRAGDHDGEVLVRLDQARALAALGRLDEAHQVVAEVAEVPSEIRDAEAVRSYTKLADSLAAAGDRPHAVELYELAAGRLGEPAAPSRRAFYAQWAELLEAEGRTAQALEVLKMAMGPGQTSSARGWVGRG